MNDSTRDDVQLGVNPGFPVLESLESSRLKKDLYPEVTLVDSYLCVNENLKGNEYPLGFPLDLLLLHLSFFFFGSTKCLVLARQTLYLPLESCPQLFCALVIFHIRSCVFFP
jgi:hypothetical protein